MWLACARDSQPFVISNIIIIVVVIIVFFRGFFLFFHTRIRRLLPHGLPSCHSSSSSRSPHVGAISSSEDDAGQAEDQQSFSSPASCRTTRQQPTTRQTERLFYLKKKQRRETDPSNPRRTDERLAGGVRPFCSLFLGRTFDLRSLLLIYLSIVSSPAISVHRHVVEPQDLRPTQSTPHPLSSSSSSPPSSSRS